MTFFTGSLRQAALAVCARDGVDVTGLPALELLALSGDVARVRRDADVLMAQVAAEVRRRSDVDQGVGLASKHGFRSAGELVAHVTGGSVAEARRYMDTGDLLVEGDHAAVVADVAVPGDGGVPTEGVTLTPVGQFRADLAVAVRAGRIGVDLAAMFIGALEGLPDVERTRDLFTKALTQAVGLPAYQVRKLVWQAQALADPKAWEAREDRQHENRTLTIRDDADGMVTLTARLTPLAAAPVRAVLDAGVRWALQAKHDDPASDTRTVCQIRADLLTDICRHMLDCTGTPSGVKTTVVVRMSLSDLQTGVGIGEIDGMPQPVSVRALRQAAADAEIIPAVLGGPSEILDWGRAQRLFTTPQRLALVERDAGCAWCNAPPSWCVAHHIRWWQRDHGLTNMNNGILLCTNCHHRIHDHGWDIQVHDNRVTFIPPPSIDPTQTPRVGGRERFDLAAQARLQGADTASPQRILVAA